MVESHSLAIRVDEAPSESARTDLSKDSGINGLSPFYRLHDLCGFYPVRDMVVDSMQAIALNLIRTELEKRLLPDLQSNSEYSIPMPQQWWPSKQICTAKTEV